MKCAELLPTGATHSEALFAPRHILAADRRQRRNGPSTQKRGPLRCGTQRSPTIGRNRGPTLLGKRSASRTGNIVPLVGPGCAFDHSAGANALFCDGRHRPGQRDCRGPHLIGKDQATFLRDTKTLALRARTLRSALSTLLMRVLPPGLRRSSNSDRTLIGGAAHDRQKHRRANSPAGASGQGDFRCSGVLYIARRGYWRGRFSAG